MLAIHVHRVRWMSAARQAAHHRAVLRRAGIPARHQRQRHGQQRDDNAHGLYAAHHSGVRGNANTSTTAQLRRIEYAH